MSSFIVPVVDVKKIEPHRNANNLELLFINGWQVVVKKGEYAVGQKVVYFPPDTILPNEWAERLGVKKYLAENRVVCVKLRGEISFGMVIPCPPELFEAEDAALYFGATKYRSVYRVDDYFSVKDESRFTKYTDIENLRNFPDVIHYGEFVVVTEKIHGSNARVGAVDGRRIYDTRKYGNRYEWKPFDEEWVCRVVDALSALHVQVILYGEVYGNGVQKNFVYDGHNKLNFRVFDIMLDGRYIDYTDLVALSQKYGFLGHLVPEIYRGEYNPRVIKYADGKSFLGNNIREGIVVRPIKERMHPKIGRVILKYISDKYLIKDYSFNEN